MDKVDYNPKITKEVAEKINKGYCPYCKQKCKVKYDRKNGWKIFKCLHLEDYRSWTWYKRI